MGIPIGGIMNNCGFCKSVENNTTKPESLLQIKKNTLCNHRVHKSIGMEESLTAHIDVNENPAYWLKLYMVEREGI